MLVNPVSGRGSRCVGRRVPVRIVGSFAVVAQLVEHELPKLGVEGSNPFRRSPEGPEVARRIVAVSGPSHELNSSEARSVVSGDSVPVR